VRGSAPAQTCQIAKRKLSWIEDDGSINASHTQREIILVSLLSGKAGHLAELFFPVQPEPS
jgi:hypothetical protein